MYFLAVGKIRGASVHLWYGRFERQPQHLYLLEQLNEHHQTFYGLWPKQWSSNTQRLVETSLFIISTDCDYYERPKTRARPPLFSNLYILYFSIYSTKYGSSFETKCTHSCTPPSISEDFHVVKHARDLSFWLSNDSHIFSELSFFSIDRWQYELIGNFVNLNIFLFNLSVHASVEKQWAS